MTCGKPVRPTTAVAPVGRGRILRSAILKSSRAYPADGDSAWCGNGKARPPVSEPFHPSSV